MGHLLLAIFLIYFGLNILFGLALPAWITGLFALVVGIALLAERFGVRVERR